MDAVTITGLTKRYGRTTAVDDLTLSVPRGEIFGLLGMNGAGKTTTMEVLCTLARPTAGDAMVAGYSVTRDPERVKERLAIVFEGGTPPRPHWTVREYLSFCQDLRGMRLNASVLDALGMGELMSRPTGALSGGQKKRVELARALLADPEVLLLDEPTKELDLKTKRVVWETIRRVNREKGTTIVLSSHDVLEMKELCSSIAVIRAGRIARLVTGRELATLDHARLETVLTQEM